jgi:hypothetical protein
MGVDAAGIDDGEGDAVPFGVSQETVSGGTGDVIDDRQRLPGQAVKQGALSDIWPPYQGDNRF